MEIYEQITQKDNTYTFVNILFENKVAVYYFSFHIKEDTCFIDKLDSTGYRSTCKSKDFVLTILSKHCKSCKLIYCFAISKLTFVFKSKLKSILSDMKKYWIEIFKILNKNSKIYILDCNSKNYLPKIYKSTSDVKFFEDDPVSKILENTSNINLDNLFRILKCRKDFAEGSLIYSMNTTNVVECNTVEGDTVEGDTVERDMVECNTVECDTVECDTVECDTINSKTVKHDNIAVEGGIEDVILSMSFNTMSDIKRSSRELYDKLNTRPVKIKKFTRIKPTLVMQQTITLQGKRNS